MAKWLGRRVEELRSDQKSRVVLNGRLEPEEMSDFFRGIDCLLILSYTESQCRLALEAMLAGTIVLARPTHGLVDLIDHGVTGFFIDPAEPQTIQTNLERLDRDPTLASTVRYQARKFALRSALDSHSNWLNFLTNLAR